MTVLAGRAIHLKIGEVVLTAASPTEARRLADALPGALRRALEGGAPSAGRRSSRSVDGVADQVLVHILAAAERRP